MEKINRFTINPDSSFERLSGAQTQAFMDMDAVIHIIPEVLGKANCDGAAIVQAMMAVREHFAWLIDEYDRRADARFREMFDPLLDDGMEDDCDD